MAAGIRIGTRGSQLALWQARWVRDALARAHPGLECDLAVIKTRGDKILDVPLAQVGGKGLFVKEIEEALHDGGVDLAVHSMKDMPADLPPGLVIGPVPRRADPRDVLISTGDLPLDDLPHGARVGTSSLRRGAQLLRLRPDLRIVSLRGNLDTRLRKLQDPQQGLAAIVLAAAGVRRLGLEARVSEYLDPARLLPAVAQGALCIEMRRDDPRVAQIAAVLDHVPSRTAVTAERAFLRRLGGSCQVPVAGYADLKDGSLTLQGLIADLDGRTVLRDSVAGAAADAEALGRDLAGRLLERGGCRILETLSAGDGRAQTLCTGAALHEDR